uniref:Electron transport protein SCO1/SenC n=1 Tax=Rhodopseudomonas palustris (strain BisA53) TaxID=316055 RepID=Q07MF0_RHOP5
MLADRCFRLSRRQLIAVAFASCLAGGLPAHGWAAPAANGSWGTTLTSHNGAVLSGEALKGRPYAIYFGYTHCPDICPTSMVDMTEVLGQLGESARDFRVYFVTVDPQRDTPALLKTYLEENFDRRIIGLTGTPEAIATVANTFGAIYRKTGSDDNYTISHTASTFLIDRRGQLFGKMPHGGPIERKVEQIKELLAD